MLKNSLQSFPAWPNRQSTSVIRLKLTMCLVNQISTLSASVKEVSWLDLWSKIVTLGIRFITLSVLVRHKWVSRRLHCASMVNSATCLNLFQIKCINLKPSKTVSLQLPTGEIDHLRMLLMITKRTPITWPKSTMKSNTRSPLNTKSDLALSTTSFSCASAKTLSSILGSLKFSERGK